MTAGKTYNPEHDNNFDLVRLLAASQVMFSHAIEHLKLPHPEGLVLWFTYVFPGVPVFFLISGFLVTQSFLNCKEQPIAFLSRRATRIYPGLFTNLLFICLLIIVCGNFVLNWRNVVALPAWFATATLMGSDYFGNLLVGSPFNWDTGSLRMFPSGVLWSISAELGFYVLVPLVFSRALRERGLRPLSIACWMGVSFSIVWLMNTFKDDLPTVLHATLYCSPFPYFWIFLVGASIQLMWSRLRWLIAGKAWLWVPVYLGVSYLDMKLFNRSVLDHQMPNSMLALRVVLMAFAVLSVAYTLPKLARILRGMDISYGVYLWHMPWITVLILFKAQPSLALWAVTVGGTMAIAAASWFIIEKPAMARKSDVSRVLTRGTEIALAGAGRMAARLPWRAPAGVRALPFGLLTSLAAFAVTVWLAYDIRDSALRRQIVGIERGAVIYALSPARPDGWSAVGGAKAAVTDGVLVVTGDQTQWGSQLFGAIIPAPAADDFILDYDVETANGHMGIGVLDGRPNGRWVTVVPQIKAATGSVRFQSSGKPLRVVLFNSNTVPSETVARVRKLELSPVR